MDTAMADSSERFVTVFDVSRTAFHWQLPALGLIFVIIGLALPAFIRFTEFKHRPRWMVTWYPRIFLSFALVWTLLTLIVTSVDDFRAKDAMRTNKAIVVEGHVSDFLPAPYTGHQLESFTVHGVHFAYADAVMTAGFNNTTLHGGPVYEGLPVKIWYIVTSNGPEIFRLDVPWTAAR